MPHANAPRLAERLRSAGDHAWQLLTHRGRRHPKATKPALVFPPAFCAMLRDAIDLETTTGTPEAEQRATTLKTLYLDWLPRRRVELLAAQDLAIAELFHTPLERSRMPRLRRVITRLEGLLGDAGLTLNDALGDALADVITATHAPQTLAVWYNATHYGSCLPMLYTQAQDLMHYARAHARGMCVTDVIDTYLVAPLLHDLMHGRRDRPVIAPLYLDECLAGALGVEVLPSSAFPSEGTQDTLFAAPTFAQVGQAMQYRWGLEAVMQAQAGVRSWSSVLGPARVETLASLGWERHVVERQMSFLSGGATPQPWVKLLLMADDALEAGMPWQWSALEAVPWCGLPGYGEERALAVVRDGVMALGLSHRQVSGRHVVARESRWRVVLDVRAGCWRQVPGQVKGTGGCEQYWCPPEVTHRWASRGVHRLEVRVGEEGVEALAARLLAGDLGKGMVVLERER